MRNRIPWHFTDVLIGILLISLLCGVGLSAAAHARETSNRIKCASNLRQIGEAILLYSNENKGAYPRTVFAGGDDPKPTWGTPYARHKDLEAADTGFGPFAPDKDPTTKYRPEPNDVTAALFLLSRTQDIGPEVFICPSAQIPKWDFGGGTNTAANWTNWDGNAGLAQHLSYSYQNPYPSNAAIKKGFRLNNTIEADFAVVADMNPGGDAVLKVTPSSPANVMRTANSMNHQRDGQNVLYGDGHVEFNETPFCGRQRDNLYTANGPEVTHPARAGKATIAASPVDQMDSILLPTAADIGFAGPPAPKPLSAAEITKFKATLMGNYVWGGANFRATTRAAARFMPKAGLAGGSAASSFGFGEAAVRFMPKARLAITNTTIQMIAGPMTVTYTYKIVGQYGMGIELEASAADIPPRDFIMIPIVGQRLIVGADGILDGVWLKAK